MSNSFNCVCTVVRDAEKRFSQSGMAILTVTVVNNQGFGDKKKSLFIRVTLFGKRAEGKLSDYLTKGAQIFVSGELSENEYQAKDGTTKKSLELNANIIDLVGKLDNGSSSTVVTKHAREATKDNFDDDFSDDIPFN